MSGTGNDKGAGALATGVGPQRFVTASCADNIGESAMKSTPQSAVTRVDRAANPRRNPERRDVTVFTPGTGFSCRSADRP